MKKVAKDYASTNDLRLPIVVVVNKCDEMAPARFKNAEDYPNIKTPIAYYIDGKSIEDAKAKLEEAKAKKSGKVAE